MLQATTTLSIYTPRCCYVCVCVCVHMLLCVGPTLNTLQTLIFANETCVERAVCMHSQMCVRAHLFSVCAPVCFLFYRDPPRKEPISDCYAGATNPSTPLCLSSALEKEQVPLCSLPPLLDICQTIQEKGMRSPVTAPLSSVGQRERNRGRRSILNSAFRINY